MIALARETIIRTIKTRTGVDLNPLIVHEESNDPITWRRRFNLDKGAILGLSHSFFNVLCFRPSTRARRGGALDGVLRQLGIPGRILELLVDVVRPGKDLKGLYMVGASAHPGTGVPIVLAGGKLVSEQICGDLGVEVPWLEEEKSVKTKGKEVNRLDRLEKPDTWLRWIGMIVVLGAVPWVLGWVVVLFLARMEGVSVEVKV
jgi:phytoene desaturase (3,4-didehydrolycopene-forming)